MHNSCSATEQCYVWNCDLKTAYLSSTLTGLQGSRHATPNQNPGQDLHVSRSSKHRVRAASPHTPLTPACGVSTQGCYTCAYIRLYSALSPISQPLEFNVPSSLSLACMSQRHWAHAWAQAVVVVLQCAVATCTTTALCNTRSRKQRPNQMYMLPTFGQYGVQRCGQVAHIPLGLLEGPCNKPKAHACGPLTGHGQNYF